MTLLAYNDAGKTTVWLNGGQYDEIESSRKMSGVVAEPRTTTDIKWNAKQAGVVYTPDHVVRFMLDDLLPDDLMGIRICEPACGEGVFLAECVQRICGRIKAVGPKRGYVESLEHLTGFDIDERAVAACKNNLTAACMEVLGANAPQIDWRIHNVDILNRQAWAQYRGTFDYIVGNPPYVRIQHLEDERRKRISSDGWRFVAGCADMYFLFFEAGLDMLKQGGDISFITPNSWLKSAAGRTLRNNLSNGHRVQKVVDFGGCQVFPSVTTYTAITRIRKGQKFDSEIPAAKAVVLGDKVQVKSGYAIDASASMWTVTSKKQRRQLARQSRNGITLGNIATIQVGIQTLADRVFILTVLNKSNEYMRCTDGSTEVLLESGSVRRIYKASVMKNGSDSVERVAIYPYDSNGLIPFLQFREWFPMASEWLAHNKKALLARDKGRIDERKWHGYGRQVGITSALGIKILTSGMNKRPNFQLCKDQDALFYSGYAIKPLPTVGVSVDMLLRALNSDEMHEFIKMTSKPYQGGWWSYAKTFIQHFPIDNRLLADV